MNIKAYLADKRKLVDQELDNLLDLTGVPSPLAEAMRYSLFPGGKRVRPILTLAASEAVGGSSHQALPFACAIELIHAYSLVHDDLPAMDDDKLRRGQPTCHVAFDEATALLAGDALLTEAFRIMAAACLTGGRADVCARVIEDVALAAGATGMVGGQAEDLKAEGKAADVGLVESIHRRKTAALIRVAARAGAIIAGASPVQLAALTSYGENLGLAFQVVDDILDEEGDSEKTGKHPGRDAELGKATYPAAVGVAAAREKAAALLATCLETLNIFGDRGEPLRQLAAYVVSRAV